MIHETACISPDAVIGDDCRIWHFCHVMGSATIGDNCVLGQGVHVAGILGNRVHVQNYVSIFDGVVIEDDVFIGPHTTFTNVLQPIPGIKQKYIKTIVRSGAVIGAGCVIVCGITIGENSFIGAGSVVTKNIPKGEIWYGNPARCRGNC